MLDRFNRNITYLRISLTDRCNLRCVYCMPAGKTTFMPQQELMNLAEIVKVVEEAAKLGIVKIRFTGGEPLLRPDIVDLTRAVSRCEGIQEVAATTNGLLLAKYARKLKQAGLNRVNISLDTLDPEKFARLTRGGNIDDVLNGIEAALETGLSPVKINFVRSGLNNEDDENAVREFCNQKGLHLQAIRQMDLNTGRFYPVEGGNGGVCRLCNRIRITANGEVKPCLHSDYRFNIREYGIRQAFMKAVNAKPKAGTGALSHQFYNIGG